MRCLCDGLGRGSSYTGNNIECPVYSFNDPNTLQYWKGQDKKKKIIVIFQQVKIKQLIDSQTLSGVAF